MKTEGQITGTIVGTGVGAAAFFIAMKASQSISFLQGKWWAAPTALLVAAHATKAVSIPAGTAAAGAAGALFAFSYYVASSQPKPQQAGTLVGSSIARGYSEAGAMQNTPALPMQPIAGAPVVSQLSAHNPGMREAAALTLNRPRPALTRDDRTPRALRPLVPVTHVNNIDSIGRALERMGGSRAGS